MWIKIDGEYKYIRDDEFATQVLGGEEISNILVSPGEGNLCIQTKSRLNVTFVAEGEGCSETWFAELIGVTNVLGHICLGITDVKTDNRFPNPEDGNTRQDSDLVYGFNIITENGDCLVVFRNSSIGYYYGEYSVLTDIVPSNDWVNVKDDWCAYGNG